MINTLEALVIEDSEEDTFLLVREIATQIPGIHHTRVETLSDLKEALTKKWDIILCDYNLPEFDGLAALQIVRGKNISAPFIVISGREEADIIALMMNAGANDYITKYNLKELVPAILKALKKAEESHELI